MIQANVSNCKTLEEFYASIRTQQQMAHGIDYCLHHEAITRFAKRGSCKVYKELGVHQGATAAAALFSPTIKTVELIDISMDLFMPSEPLFRKYCKIHKKHLLIFEADSTNPAIAKSSKCDMLLVDSVHQPKHMLKEIKLHSPSVSKYMIFHDTSRPDNRLYRALAAYVNEPDCDWEIIEHCEENVGYTVLGRKGIEQ